MYWVITTPLTLLVFSIWRVWISLGDRKRDQSTVTAEEDLEEKEPWYRRWVHKTSDVDDAEKHIESEDVLQVAFDQADTGEQIMRDDAVQLGTREQDAPATSAATPLPITRNDTLLQDPVK